MSFNVLLVAYIVVALYCPLLAREPLPTTQNFIDYPPRIHRTSSTTPPRIHRTSSTTNFIDSPPRIHRTSSTTPLEFTELHRLPPSNSQNFIDYPPRIHRTSSTTPPRIHRTSSTTPPPPSNSRELHRLRTSSTTPLEFTELHRLPPSNSQNFIDYPPPVEFTKLHRLPPPPPRILLPYTYIPDILFCLLLISFLATGLLPAWKYIIYSPAVDEITSVTKLLSQYAIYNISI